MDYKDTAEYLSNFIRCQSVTDSKTMAEGVSEKDYAKVNLFSAIYAGKGDFNKNTLVSFQSANEPITSSLWHKKSRTKPNVEKPELFTFDDALSSIGVLTSCFGDKADVMFAPLESLAKNSAKRLEWMRKTSQVKNPPNNPYQEVVNQLKEKIDDTSVHETISTVFEQVNDIQEMLNTILHDPSDPHSAANGKIKTSASRTKKYVLGNDGLGAVFKLVRSTEWGLLVDADSKWINKTIDKNLHLKPSYSDVTFNPFMHASLTIVNALLAYAFLYPLPDEAFGLNWDGNVWDENDKQRNPYNYKKAIKATKSVSSQDFHNTSWDALLILADRLDSTRNLNSSFVKRLRHAKQIWSRIFQRLNMVSMQVNLPAKRNGYWYLDEGKSQTIEVDVDEAYGDLEKWNIVCDNSCGRDHVALYDSSLNTPIRDGFIEPYRHFSTTLNLNWHVDGDTESVLVGIFSLGTTAAGTAILVKSLNDNFSAFHYPLERGGDHSDDDVQERTYDEVFWTAYSPDYEKLWYADRPGYLATQQGRDTIAWLGLVLQNYCSAYNFSIDTKNDTNTLQFAEVVHDLYTKTHQVIDGLLGESTDDDVSNEDELTFEQKKILQAYREFTSPNMAGFNLYTIGAKLQSLTSLMKRIGLTEGIKSTSDENWGNSIVREQSRYLKKKGPYTEKMENLNQLIANYTGLNLDDPNRDNYQPEPTPKNEKEALENAYQKFVLPYVGGSRTGAWTHKHKILFTIQKILIKLNRMPERSRDEQRLWWKQLMMDQVAFERDNAPSTDKMKVFEKLMESTTDLRF